MALVRGMLVRAHPSEVTDLVGQSPIGQYCTQLTAHDTQQTTVFIRDNNGGNPEPSSISMLQARIVSHDISLTLVGTCMCENESGECSMTITFGEIILAHYTVGNMCNSHASLCASPPGETASAEYVQLTTGLL